MANNWHQNKIDSVHFVLCPKQGNGMEVVSNPKRPTYIEILVEYPNPPPWAQRFSSGLNVI